MNIYEAAFQKGSALYNAIEILMKGMEAKLPDGITFIDLRDKERDKVRVKWWVCNGQVIL
jgi:hypothetical protein